MKRILAMKYAGSFLILFLFSFLSDQACGNLSENISREVSSIRRTSTENKTKNTSAKSKKKKLTRINFDESDQGQSVGESSTGKKKKINPLDRAILKAEKQSQKIQKQAPANRATYMNVKEYKRKQKNQEQPLGADSSAANPITNNGSASKDSADTDTTANDLEENASNSSERKAARTEDKKAKRKKAEESVTDINLRRTLRVLDPDEKRWTIRPYYRMSTDLADQGRPRLYSHGFGGSFEYSFTQSLTAYISTELRVTSLNGSVQENGNDQVTLGDLDIGMSFPLLDKSRIKVPLIGQADIYIPTSDESRYEGYFAVVRVGVNSIFSLSNLSIIPSVAFTYISNKYQDSPTTFEVNQDYISNLGLLLNYRLGLGFSAGLRGGFSYAHFLDDTATSNFSTGVSLGYNAFDGRLSMNLSFLNGSYADQTSMNLWFIDQYRQMMNFSISTFY